MSGVTRNSTNPEPLKIVSLPQVPWCEVSIDFAGPLPSNDMLLVAIDDYSRFSEVEITGSTSAKTVVQILASIFSRQGIPETVYTDNGPPFQGEKFSSFCKDPGFKHRA